MFQITVVEKISTHVLCSIAFRENGGVYELMWKKYNRARQAAGDDVMWRRKCAICVPDVCEARKARVDTH